MESINSSLSDFEDSVNHPRERTFLFSDFESEYEGVDDISENILRGVATHVIYEDYDRAPLNESESESLTQKVVEGGKTNYLWSVFNLWNDVLGCGMVAMPFYVTSLGLWMVPIVFAIFGVLTVYTLNVVFYLAKKYRQRSYVELCQYALGVPGYVLVCFFIFVFNFGGLVGALQIVGSNVPHLLRNFIGDYHFFNRFWVLIFAVTIFLPIAFFKRISSFTINSFLSILSLVGVALLMLMTVIVDREKYPLREGALDFKLGNSVLPALGGMSYIFVCHDLSFNVFDEFKNANRQRWRYVVSAVIVLTQLVLCTIGFSGHFMFYDDVEDNVLDNFPQDHLFANLARICVSLNIVISIPYSAFMPRISIYSILSLILGPNMNHKVFHVITTIAVMGGALLIAELVDDLGATFELVGGVSAVGLAFILPPTIFLKMEKGRLLTSPKKLLNALILIAGLIVMVSSTVSTLMTSIV